MLVIRPSSILILIVVSLVSARKPRTDITVSGLSSGAAMATQLHIALSKDISGCGVLAGPPYYCGGNGMTMSLCMTGPAAYISVPTIQWKIESNALSNSIDEPSTIVGDPVYIFSGIHDPVVYPGTVKLNEELYSRLGADIKTNFDMAASHGFPTDNYGDECAVLNKKTYINNCDFNMAYDMLNHLYSGALIQPSSQSKTFLAGQLLLFDQEAFINAPASLTIDQNSSFLISQWMQENMALHNSSNWQWSTTNLFNITIPSVGLSLEKTTTSNIVLTGFDRQGFVYFPSACANGQKCSIHIALHGCEQGKSLIGDVFVTKAGYLEVAELNNIIVIFPQILESMVLPTNPMGCWDWWGYSSTYYTTRNAPQISGIKKIVDTVRMINDAFVTSK